MKKLSQGQSVPLFTFECTDPNIRSFKDLQGHNFVLYFYPKDNTPGCTVESKAFRDLHSELLKLNTRVLGVSRDNLASHQKFCSKLELPFPLISDPEEKLCEFFNVLIEKNMFLRKFLGIERSTFLIDQKGVIRHVWRKVKVKGHAEEVLKAAKNAMLVV